MTNVCPACYRDLHDQHEHLFRDVKYRLTVCQCAVCAGSVDGGE